MFGRLDILQLCHGRARSGEGNMYSRSGFRRVIDNPIGLAMTLRHIQIPFTTSFVTAYISSLR